MKDNEADGMSKNETFKTKSIVLSATGADNTNANPNDIIFPIKNTKLYVPVVNLSANDNQKL